MYVFAAREQVREPGRAQPDRQSLLMSTVVLVARLPASACERILVLNDDKDTLSTLRDILELHGSIVATAASVEEADRLLDNGFQPSAILLDLRLGGEPSGCKYAERLRTDPRYGSVPVVAMSGDAGELRRLDLADAKLMKPFDPTHLFETLQELCRAK